MSQKADMATTMNKLERARAAARSFKAKGINNAAVGATTLLQTGAGLGPVYVNPPEMSCKSGGSWNRPSGDVANSADGVADCASKCAGYVYFGLECPRSNAVHCQCSNSLAGSNSVDGSNCQSNTGPSNSHCNGPYTHGDYMMGGHGFGSVYMVQDNSLHFNTVQSDPASPISDATSICRAWYISDGPVKHQSNQAAADAMKSAGTWEKGTTERRGTPPTGSGTTTDGTGWAVGYKRGCTEATNVGGALFTICGCYEIWCPVRTQILSHPDDIYGRDASGVDGSMPVRRTCYSARAVFGCYAHGAWLDNCGWQRDGLYLPGSGSNTGQFLRLWEQLIM